MEVLNAETGTSIDKEGCSERSGGEVKKRLQRRRHEALPILTLTAGTGSPDKLDQSISAGKPLIRTGYTSRPCGLGVRENLPSKVNSSSIHLIVFENDCSWPASGGAQTE